MPRAIRPSSSRVAPRLPRRLRRASPGPAPTRARTTGLHVRADLVPLLRFAQAERTEVRAAGGRRLRGLRARAPVRRASPFAAAVERVLVNVGDKIVARGTPAPCSAPLTSPGELPGDSIADLDAARDDVERSPGSSLAGAASSASSSPRGPARRRWRPRPGRGAALSAAGVRGGGPDAFTLRASAAGQVIARSVDPGERRPVGRGARVRRRPVGGGGTGGLPRARSAAARAGRAVLVRRGRTRRRAFRDGRPGGPGRSTPATHTATAICRPSAVDPRMRAEMVARVEVAVRRAGAHPARALLLRGDDRVVFVRRGRRARAAHDEAGAQFNDRVQVRSGPPWRRHCEMENAVLLDGELDRLPAEGRPMFSALARLPCGARPCSPPPRPSPLRWFSSGDCRSRPFPDVTDPMVEVVGLYPASRRGGGAPRHPELERASLAGTPTLTYLRPARPSSASLVTLKSEGARAILETRAQGRRAPPRRDAPAGVETVPACRPPVGQIFRYTLRGRARSASSARCRIFVVERRPRAPWRRRRGHLRRLRNAITRFASTRPASPPPTSPRPTSGTPSRANANAWRATSGGSQELVVRGLGAAQSAVDLGEAVWCAKPAACRCGCATSPTSSRAPPRGAARVGAATTTTWSRASSSSAAARTPRRAGVPDARVRQLNDQVPRAA